MFVWILFTTLEQLLIFLMCPFWGVGGTDTGISDSVQLKCTAVKTFKQVI